MSKKLHRLIWAEWSDHQPEVHPVWEARIIPSIEEYQERTSTKNTSSSAELTFAKPGNSDTKINKL